MTYKCGSWGGKARTRSKKRKQYFLDYQKKNRLNKKIFIPKGCPKRNARQRVRDHILNEKIIKPKKCEKCLEEKRLEAHHEDYSKPLEVIFLCKPCHIEADLNLKSK